MPKSSLRRCQLCLLFGVVLLQGCVSYEPARLVPALTLSAEDITLVTAAPESGAALEFGLTVTVNESDSLANVAVLPGVRVRAVTPNGPAETAGIRAGDVILAVNDMETNNPDALTALRQQAPDSNGFRFRVRRNTAVFEATVMARVVNRNTPPRELYRADPIATRAGYRTELVTRREQPTLAAARVVELFPESPLPAAGINVGDLILTLEGLPVNSAQGLINRLNREFELGDRVELSVYDGTAVSTTTVSLWNPGRRISRIALGPLLQYQSSLNPSSDSLSILDLWLFSFYSYTRTDGEKTHSLLGLFKFSTNYGELIEEAN